ncbi:hypothetical protein HN51_008481 [Arachis hypogaea]|uniref:FLZ-type domain-containing protein n=2 Tax=Arachis TaxID=3817 RepID=A0A445D393_ARAHY|nr:FCS-Like Zinc finger 15 [Arachis duranensis]XP_025700756.1 FCS-Like Zinc finger 15 isoform X1 [Arachis hypogaea]QHO42798.1 uncharacterized protein DS421_5g157340 [Arachis hypogaea]RYR57689.1 hypothetical protein Ahy_A05g023389 [Arachis hypogaea]
MENSNSNSNSSKQQKNRNRMMMLEGGVVGLGIVAAMSITKNNSISTHNTDIVSSAKAAANFRGINTKNNGLFFASTFSKIGSHFVSPSSYFLNSCNLCNKHLHGVDIFMYRGERAFCSAECRETHIRNDDYQEKCLPGVMKPLDCSTSPCSGPPVSLAGVAVA